MGGALGGAEKDQDGGAGSRSSSGGATVTEKKTDRSGIYQRQSSTSRHRRWRKAILRLTVFAENYNLRVNKVNCWHCSGLSGDGGMEWRECLEGRRGARNCQKNWRWSHTPKQAHKPHSSPPSSLFFSLFSIIFFIFFYFLYVIFIFFYFIFI